MVAIVEWTGGIDEHCYSNFTVRVSSFQTRKHCYIADPFIALWRDVWWRSFAEYLIGTLWWIARQKFIELGIFVGASRRNFEDCKWEALSYALTHQRTIIFRLDKLKSVVMIWLAVAPQNRILMIWLAVVGASMTPEEWTRDCHTYMENPCDREGCCTWVDVWELGAPKSMVPFQYHQTYCSWSKVAQYLNIDCTVLVIWFIISLKSTIRSVKYDSVTSFPFTRSGKDLPWWTSFQNTTPRKTRAGHSKSFHVVSVSIYLSIRLIK